MERVALLLLQRLDRRRFQPILILQRRDGDYLRLLGPDVEVIALRRRRPPFCVAELAGILRARRVDIVHTATNATNIYAALAAALAGRGVRAVISEHTPLDFSLSEAKLLPLRRAGMRLAYRRAALAIAPLAQIGDELGAFLGPACPPFRCLPNPVVETLTPPRPVAPVALRLAAVGRLAAVKRFDLLLEAFARFRQGRPAARLTLLGDGPERGALEALAARLGLGGAVEFAGYVEDVPARLREMDLLVCTSRREGFGNVIVEAMAAGVPVVSVDCPFGPAILLRGGAAGRLVAEAEPAALAAALETTAADPDLRAAYVAAGREVAAAFTVDHAVAAYAAAFLAAAGHPAQA